MDGLSCELIYNYGRLVKGITRGDGVYGEDVTRNVITIPNIPLEIRFTEKLIVRGEVVVHKEDFVMHNMNRKRNNLPLFSNCRNYAAGSLRQKDPEITRSRHLKFYAWEMSAPSAKKLTHEESVTVLMKLGFSVPKGRLCHGLDDVMNEIHSIQLNRKNIPFDIDGAVIKCNDPDIHPVLGWNNHAPLFNIAYKFVAQETRTAIEKIIWSMGRSGKLTPVAVIKPVNIQGVTINNVTLNNVDFVEKNNLGVGSVVDIKRAADVIPKIATVVTPSTVDIPQTCPYCGKPLVRSGTELKCVNRDCKEMLIKQLSHLVSKDCANIKGYGEKFMREAVTSGTFTSIMDIFSIQDSKSKDISQTSLNTLTSAIRNISLTNLLIMLNIPGCGRTVVWKLVQEASTLSGIKELFLSDKLKYVNISNAVKDNIRQWVNDTNHIELMDKLIALKLPKC
jgi:DNA ligase (NAD+)